MKRRFQHYLTLISIALLSINFAFADTPPTPSSTTLNEITSLSGKKRLPSKRHIDCEIINNMLVFDANFEYAYMEVEISGPESLSDMLTPTQPYIEAPTLTGTYTIRCTTDGGAVYEGTITL